MEYNKPPPYNPEPPPQYAQSNQPPYPPNQLPYPPSQQPYPPYQQPIQQQPYPQHQQPIHVTVQQSPPRPNTIVVTAPTQIVTGNCPGCRRGNLGLSFTCCGILCCIFFFPIGIICCFLFADKKCSHCGGIF